MKVSEGGLQQLGEARSPWLSRGGLFALEVWGLLVLQLQLCQLQHQRLLPHCPLGRRSAFGEGPQVGNGESKPEDGVRREESEGGVELSALCLREKKVRNLLVFIHKNTFTYDRLMDEHGLWEVIVDH